METEFEQIRAEVAHLKAKLGCAEEEKIELMNTLSEGNQVFSTEKELLVNKLHNMEEVLTERTKQVDLLTKEHVSLIQEVGRLHMESRHVKDMLLRLQQENNELKYRLSAVDSASASASDSTSNIRIARITPHDKKDAVHAELESAPPRRKAGL
jgi:hypothetical protein